jgi:methyl-accepting chemotaxis protein
LERRLVHLMSKPKPQAKSTQNLKKSTKLSAQAMCEELLRISKAEKWTQKSYQNFIDLIINPEIQYQLNTTQKGVLTEAILTCPSDYRSLLHLTLVLANSNQPKGLYTLNGIITKITEYIIDCLSNKYKFNNILIVENYNNLKQWLSKQTKHNQNTKLDLCRNLVTIIIAENKPLISYIDIILEFFSGLDSLQESKSSNVTQQKTKAIIDFFQLHKPTSTEAERLLLYGNYSQKEIQQYHTKIAELKSQIRQLQDNLGKIQTVCQQKTEQITQLQNQLTQTKVDLEQTQNELAKETQLYQQLDSSSQAKITQEKNATINQINKRIEHELKKLERCFNSKNVDNFTENQEIGLKIIEKIRKQLLIEE